MFNVEKKVFFNYLFVYIYNVIDYKFDIYIKYNIYISIDNVYIMNFFS